MGRGQAGPFFSHWEAVRCRTDTPSGRHTPPHIPHTLGREASKRNKELGSGEHLCANMQERTKKEVRLHELNTTRPCSVPLCPNVLRMDSAVLRDPYRRPGYPLTALSGSVPEAEVHAPRLRSTAPLLAQMVYLDGEEDSTGSHLGSGKSTLQESSRFGLKC